MAEISYRRHRFPPVIIQHAVWVYLRFTLSYRDVEELLAERGLDISYETVRCWVLKFTDLELVPHGSLLTPRWRGLDSNFPFLDASRAFFSCSGAWSRKRSGSFNRVARKRGRG